MYAFLSPIQPFSDIFACLPSASQRVSFEYSRTYSSTLQHKVGLFVSLCLRPHCLHCWIVFLLVRCFHVGGLWFWRVRFYSIPDCTELLFLTQWRHILIQVWWGVFFSHTERKPLRQEAIFPSIQQQSPLFVTWPCLCIRDTHKERLMRGIHCTMVCRNLWWLVIEMLSSYGYGFNLPLMRKDDQMRRASISRFGRSGNLNIGGSNSGRVKPMALKLIHITP